MEGRCRPAAEPPANEPALPQPSPLTAPVAASDSTRDGTGNAAALELMEMMQRITALAPQLTFCELMQASKIMTDILHVRAQAGTHQQQSSSEADSPLRPQQLDYSPDGPSAGSGASFSRLSCMQAPLVIL